MGYTKSLGLCVASSPQRARVITRAPESARTKTVLIADPNESWREWLSRKFTAAGMEPLQAASLSELRELASRNSIDIVTSELSFKDGTWFEVTSAIKSLLPDARVVVVTGTGSIASAVEAIRHGVTGYLSKPVTPEHILKAAEPDGEPSCADSDTSMSLDRMIWEHLTQTVCTCGSIAGAARSLRLDRRSLRRMLSKNPPPR